MTDKERLKEIEVKYSILTVSSEKNSTEYTEVDVKDLVFLIQNGFKQAERVEELEMKLSINTNNMKQLQKENECYKQRVEELEKELTHQAEHFDICYYVIEKEKKVVEEQNKHYKQALEFYADKENHVAPFLYTGNDGIPVHDESEVDMDEGKIARQALGQEESK